uniref:Reverse transcriptase domain-containing protein n=1 Tax=Tanacetum cinerariifolium TaxID=118510 RepID=A0A6L2K1W5_TANCI|nr:reverse transcriptase domain-containing protein [Tanacetum cinerariifolium]
MRNILGNKQISQDMKMHASDAALREYCEENYYQLLPIIAEKVYQEKVQQEKLKAVISRLNFEEVSQHSESGTPSRRRDLTKRLESRCVYSVSRSPEPRRDRPMSPRKKDPERKTMFKRLEKGVFHWLGDKGKNSYDDLKEAFLANFRQQKKCIKYPVEIHHIKHREAESMKDFVHRGVAAGNQEWKKSLPPWKQQEAKHKQSFIKEVFKINKGQNGDRIGCPSVRQKRRSQAADKNQAIQEEVKKLVDVDFKDLNKACPKDGYSLPKINWKVESLCGFPFKCFLDAYKGYNEIKMAKEDEEKTTFITSQGVFCYSKIPFDLKNARAQYQRLVDKTFHKQIDKNLKVYVDDLVIKSRTEDEIIRDIEETFKTLREVNMKLNPKNDVQKLNEKLASLNRFLDKPAKKSLPFFKTLKKCIKKSDFHWTEDAESVFKQIKQLIAELPTLTATEEKEELIVYLAAANEAVNKARVVRRKSQRFAVINEVLYKESFLGPWLRCVGLFQDNYVLREIHERSYSMHAGTRSVVAKALGTGYYWPTMHKSARALISACQDCQVHKPVLRNPQQKLKPITSPWPFYKWGINITRPFPKGHSKVKFLIVAIDYFTKCIEANLVATIIGNQCEKLCIHQRFASVKHPQENSTEAVIPAEIGMHILRTAKVDMVQNNKALEINMDLLEERREQAAIREAKSKARMDKYNNSKVRNTSFKPGA